MASMQDFPQHVISDIQRILDNASTVEEGLRHIEKVMILVYLLENSRLVGLD